MQNVKLIKQVKMDNKPKKKCCNGCQNGKTGSNPSCQAKLMVEAMKKGTARTKVETKKTPT